MCFEESPRRGPVGMSASESHSSRFMGSGYRIRGLSPTQPPPASRSRSFVWVTADGRLKATPLSVLQKMGGYGALVLDTIGAAAAPVLLLIGEENKHHGVLEVLRETIEVFPGIFDDTADMMRHGKARYAVEKGDDGLKYRILDFDVAPQPAAHERPNGLWELPKRKRRGQPRTQPATVLKADAPGTSPRYGALLEGLAYPPLPEVSHRLAEEKRPSTRKPKVRDPKPGGKQSALDNSAETAHACRSGCTCRGAEEAQLRQLEQRAATRRAGRERRRHWVGVSDLEGTELDHIIDNSGMWKRDPDGDVVVEDERDAVDKDGVLIAVDNTPLHSRVTWKDSDLQESKRQSIVSSAGPEPGDRCSVTQVRCRVAHGITVVGSDLDPTVVKNGGEAIVDGGATETFITERMAKDLGIRELVGDRRVQVKGVGVKVEWARGGNSVELLMRCRCSTCGDKWIPRIHHSVYIWEGEGMTENLISPHGFGDMWHVTGPGESCRRALSGFGADEDVQS